MPTLCAFAWFGHACGSSMASGRLAVQYCSRHGVAGILSAVLIWVFTAVWIFITMEYARVVKATNYYDIVTSIYWDNKVVGRIAGVIWDLIQLFSIVVVSGSCISGSGTILEAVFGLNYNIGMLIFVILMLILFSTGSSILATLGKMSFPMFFLLIMVCIVAILVGWDNLKDVFSGAFNDVLTDDAGTFSGVLRDSLTYAAAQLGFIATAAPYAGSFESRRDNVKVLALGFAVGCSAMVMTTIATLATFPQCITETLPFLTVLKRFSGLGGAIFHSIYFIVLYIAYSSTAGSMIAGGVARYKKRLGKLVRNEKICTAILVLFFLCASMLVGSMGLNAIVARCYGMLGMLRLPTWFFPILILGPISIRREIKKRQV